MVSLIFFIAVLNLFLGFALAVFLEPKSIADTVVDESDPPSPAVSEAAPAAPAPIVQPPEDSADDEEPELPTDEPAEEDVEVLAAPERPSDLEAVPAAWIEALRSHDIEAESFVEAATYVLQLEVEPYIEKLVELDAQIREAEDKDQLSELGNSLTRANEAWMDQVGQVTSSLSENEAALQSHQSLGSMMLETIQRQGPLIREYGDAVTLSDEVDATRDSCLDATVKLLDLAFELRDVIQGALIKLLREEDRLGDYHRKYQFDQLTGIQNRAGLETLFQNWWREDSARTRLVSAALIDMDEVGALNRKFGAAVADRMIAATGQLIKTLCSRESGLDHACRFAGTQFAVFFGDTGPRNALSVVERIRQTVENTTFDLEGEDVLIGVSCSVTEANGEDTVDSLFDRLGNLIDACKASGRNCTRLNEGNGVETVTPPEFQVKARVIKVET